MNLLYQRIGGREGISNLLKHFYADVRQDPLIGPIFNAQIEDWKKHLEIIANFWETVIGGPRTYGRPMPMIHVSLQLREEHFGQLAWLCHRGCRAQLPDDTARETIDLSQDIAGKLRLILGISSTA
jgi:hemoglobin